MKNPFASEKQKQPLFSSLMRLQPFQHWCSWSSWTDSNTSRGFHPNLQFKVKAEHWDVCKQEQSWGTKARLMETCSHDQLFKEPFRSCQINSRTS